MAKLSRSQIISARKQAREAREQLHEEFPDEIDLNKEKEKRDSVGLTRADREEIRGAKASTENQVPKITWNYSDGELVYLPDMSIGMIVKNSAADLPINYTSTDMKKTMKANKYAGKVFVVTSSGNQWFSPNVLKKVANE